MARVEHQWHIRQLVAANAPASAERMGGRKGDNHGFGCDLEASNAWAILDGRQHESDIQLGSSESIDVLFGAPRLRDDFDTRVPPLELGRHTLR